MAYDPQKIINTANSFLLAADRALEQRPVGPGQLQVLFVPAIVSTAFAVELYFKSIVTLENGNAKGHELSGLFERLSLKSQATLVASFQIDPPAFKQKMKGISDAFIEWRYIFEQQSANLDFQFLKELAQASRLLAESLLTLKET
ncbi:MAG: hypothetical protein Q8K18_17245 [Burkholderiales bacterium]|nr:hypothetical protein [Burkholderiales bacterium]